MINEGDEMIVSVPKIETELFKKYFECVWNMEAGQDWSENYRVKQALDCAIEHYSGEHTSFIMLTKAHDIIYDRE